MLKEKAALVSDLMVTHHSVSRSLALDPMMILAIIQIIILIVKLVIACRSTPSQAVAKFQKPGIIGQRRLRTIIRRTLLRHARDRKDLYALRAKIESSLRTVGLASTVEDLAHLFAEVSPKE